MKALILAAGYGRRMRPLTDHTHKTLLEVGGQSILRRIVAGVAANGIAEVVVVTGYRAAEVEAHLRSAFPALRFHFVENARYRETNNIYSMALALEQVEMDDDLLLIESDLVYEPAVIARLLRSPHPNAALVDRYRTGMDGTVVRVEGGVVTEVIPPHLQHGDFSFADKYKTLNVYRFSREFCATTFKKLLTYYAQVIDDNCYYELILGILIYMRQVTVGAEVLEGERWAEVDDPNDLRVAQFVFEPAARARILEETRGGYWAFDVLDFSYIRNVHFPTPAVFAELRATLPALLQNYGSAQKVLDEKLAYLLLASPARLRALNGAAQLFPFLRGRYAGQRVLRPEPSFGEWAAAFPEAATYPDRVGVDPDALGAAAARCDVLIVVNPNNPSGTHLPPPWIHALARARPGLQVIVDESFQAFAEGPSVRELLEAEPLANVLVLASLSKSLGVPGARLGYASTCDAALHAEIGRFLPIWSLNSVAEHLLELLLKHRESLAQSFVRTREDRELFRARLAEVKGVRRVYPSAADFVLVELDGDAAAAARLGDRLLREHAVLVKDVSARIGGGRGYLRLAVRLPAENDRLCGLLDGLA